MYPSSAFVSNSDFNHLPEESCLSMEMDFWEPVNGGRWHPVFRSGSVPVGRHRHQGKRTGRGQGQSSQGMPGEVAEVMGMPHFSSEKNHGEPSNRNWGNGWEWTYHGLSGDPWWLNRNSLAGEPWSMKLGKLMRNMRIYLEYVKKIRFIEFNFQVFSENNQNNILWLFAA